MEKSSVILLALTIIAALGLFSLSPQSDDDAVQHMYQYKIEFDNFKHTYAKKYTIEEEAFRFKIFKDNVDKMIKHNADTTQTYTMGITQFADLTTE